MIQLQIIFIFIQTKQSFQKLSITIKLLIYNTIQNSVPEQKYRQMSRNYHTATQSFYMNQNKIKEIVQTELEDFFIGIKQEIQNKIKQIDHSILDLKTDIKKLQYNGEINSKSISEISSHFQLISQKIQQIQKQRDSQMERLIQEMKNKTFDKSFDRRDKSPIFRKTTTAPSLDLNNLIFGEDSLKSNNNIQTVLKGQQQNKQNNYQKPPLPKIKHPQPKQVEQKLQFNHKNSQIPKFDQRNYPLVSQPVAPQNSYVNQFSITSVPNYYSFTPNMTTTSTSSTNIKQSSSLPSSTFQTSSHSPSPSPLLHSSSSTSNIHPNHTYETRSEGQSPHQSNNGEEYPLQSEISHRLAQNLNKNKNSFMRKKSLKKFGTIHEEQIQQSMMSTT